MVVEWVQILQAVKSSGVWLQKNANVFNSSEMDTWKWKWSHSVISNSLRPHGLYPSRRLHPGKSTGVGCHFLLQGIFLTQRSNLGLPHCRQIFYHLSHQRSLKNGLNDQFYVMSNNIKFKKKKKKLSEPLPESNHRRVKLIATWQVLLTHPASSPP